MPKLAYRDYYSHVAVSDPHVKLPFVALDSLYRFLLSNAPSLSVIIEAADMCNPLVGVHTVGLINAEDLIGHLVSPVI
jgi:hypothetical protein